MPQDQPAVDNPSTMAPIQVDALCVFCQYNLRGLDCEGHCPECGSSIRLTLAAIAAANAASLPTLWESSPRWLNAILAGLGAALALFALHISVALLPPEAFARPADYVLTIGCFSCAMWAISWFSAWKLATNENAFERNKAHTSGLRFTATASLLLPLLTIVSLGYSFRGWAVILFLLIVSLHCAASVLFYLRLRDLVRRLNRTFIQVQLTLLAWFGAAWFVLLFILPSSHGRPNAVWRLLEVPSLQFGAPNWSLDLVQNLKYGFPDIFDLLPVAAQLWAACLIAIGFASVWRARNLARERWSTRAGASENMPSNSQT